MPSAQITVEHSGDTVYRVTVHDGKTRTTHDVTVTPEDVTRFAPGATPERLLEASFEFLLDREPASAIRVAGDRALFLRVSARDSSDGGLV